MEVGVGVVEAPDAQRGQRGSGGGRGVDHGTVYDGSVFESGATTAAGDERAETVDGWFGWRTGLGSGLGVVGREVGKWRGWVGAAGVAGRWIEEAAACEVDGEGG